MKRFLIQILWILFAVILGYIVIGMFARARVLSAEAPSVTPCADMSSLEEFAKCEVTKHWGEDQWLSFYTLIKNESGWDPCAYYPGKSDCTVQPETACGLVQAVPCSKLGKDWADGHSAVLWGIQYVSDNYGTPKTALKFWGCKWDCYNPHKGVTINKKGKTWY